MPGSGAMATVIELYGTKVREIALLQCRCETGADLVADRPRGSDEEPDPPEAA